MRNPKYISKISESDFLDMFYDEEERAEFLDGDIYLMAGASENHNQITANLSGLLYNCFRGKNCRHFQSDLFVKVIRTGLIALPDIVIVCGERYKIKDEKGRELLTNPTVLIEVLSPKSIRIDKLKKYNHYRFIESLTDYIVVDQHTINVLLFKRQKDNVWISEVYDDPDDVIEIINIDCKLRLRDIYERIEFSTPGE